MPAKKLTVAQQDEIRNDPRWVVLQKGMSRTAGYIGQEFDPTVELICDAGRLAMHGGPEGVEGEKFLTELYKKYDVMSIWKFLAKTLYYTLN